MHFNKAINFILIGILLSSASRAQVSGLPEPNAGKLNSPYSRFGLGNISDAKSVVLKGMAGVANGYASEHEINTTNPASYTYLKSTAFNFGISGQSLSAKIGNTVTQSSTMTIDHLNLAFPLVQQHLAINFGYTPISSAYYNSRDSIMIDNIKGFKTYNGTGGLHYGFVGVSGGWGGFSAGVNAGYLFGNYRNSSYFALDTGYALTTRITDTSTNMNYGSLYFKGGLMYKAKLKKDHYLSVGATASISNKLNAIRNGYLVASTTGQTVVDTVSASYNEKGAMTLPANYGFGIHFGKQNNYDFGVDFEYADWQKFSRFSGNPEFGVGTNAYRLAAGGEILPNPKATTKQYFSAITYRVGAYYGKDYFNINNTAINYYGGTFGVQLPFRPSPNSEQIGALNLSLDLGNRGTIQNGLAKEFYTKFSVGVKFNAKWFERFKFN
ncbi:MAG TPA: hypothetical protein PKX92_06800 [Edaphocola sp.]|nr:hypothetical protein [Edaphocola sp.]